MSLASNTPLGDAQPSSRTTIKPPPEVTAAPGGANYRFELIFASEKQRKAWVATPTHQKVWPTIENRLTSKDYTVLFYDEAGQGGFNRIIA